MHLSLLVSYCFLRIFYKHLKKLLANVLYYNPAIYIMADQMLKKYWNKKYEAMFEVYNWKHTILYVIIILKLNIKQCIFEYPIALG